MDKSKIKIQDKLNTYRTYLNHTLAIFLPSFIGVLQLITGDIYKNRVLVVLGVVLALILLVVYAVLVVRINSLNKEL